MRSYDEVFQDICDRLVPGALIKYLDIYTIAQDDVPIGFASALPHECVGVVTDLFAAIMENPETGEESVFWNYEIYRTEGFWEVITGEDIEWLIMNQNFEILYSPEENE